jgi:hypothetical protein
MVITTPFQGKKKLLDCVETCYCWIVGHDGEAKVPKCSEVTLDAITADDSGKTYAFTGKN